MNDEANINGIPKTSVPIEQGMMMIPTRKLVGTVASFRYHLVHLNCSFPQIAVPLSTVPTFLKTVQQQWLRSNEITALGSLTIYYLKPMMTGSGSSPMQDLKWNQAKSAAVRSLFLYKINLLAH